MVEISGVAYRKQLSFECAGIHEKTYLEDIRRTVKIMNIFDWNDVKEWELSPLYPMSVTST